MGYFGDYFEPATTVGGVTPPDGTSTAPDALSQVYCTDEDILLRSPHDYANLCPRSQVMAEGTDGAFSAGSPWSLSSTAVDFSGLGVAANCVISLTKPATQYPSPLLLAINSVGTHTALLRRPGRDLGVGQPPAPDAGLSGVTFRVLTFGPQIESVSYDARKFFGIDDNLPGRSHGELYDPRELQQYVVLGVLRRLYIAAEKTATGDYKLKLADVSEELENLRSRLSLHWGSLGQDRPPTSVFSARTRR